MLQQHGICRIELMRRLALLLMSLLLVAPSSFHRLLDGDAKVATAATGSAQLGTDTGAWRHLRSSLLTEASARQEARTVANGKFPLSTGAWYMTDTYAKQASGITVLANGTRVCAAGASCGYRLDEKLVPCLGAHFGRRTVTELGAGVGRYQQALLSLGQVLPACLDHRSHCPRALTA